MNIITSHSCTLHDRHYKLEHGDLKPGLNIIPTQDSTQQNTVLVASTLFTMGTHNSIEPLTRRHPIMVSLRTLPEIRIHHVTKVSRQAPISSPIVRDALQPHFIVKLICQLDLTRFLGAGAAVRVFFAYSDIDEVLGAELGFKFGNWHGCRRWSALVHFAGSVFVVVPELFEEGNGAAVVEVD